MNVKASNIPQAAAAKPKWHRVTHVVGYDNRRRGAALDRQIQRAELAAEERAFVISRHFTAAAIEARVDQHLKRIIARFGPP